MFQWLNRDKPAPEALELDAKLQQLEVLEERYAEVQTEHVTLQNALAAFKLRYSRRVGALYARLDELRAEIARVRARLLPRDPLRQAAVKAAATQAQASADAAREIHVEAGSEEFEPSEDLRKSYRLAAKIVHPDRAGDDEDRDLRDEIMSRINVAYRDGHVHTIQALIDEYQMRAQTGEDDAATRLIRTIRLMSRVREQIGEISQASVTLRESGLYRLFKTVEDAETRGEDKLQVIETGIRRDIARAEGELQTLQQQLNARLLGEAVPKAAAAVAVAQSVAEEMSVACEAEVPEPAASASVPEPARTAQVCSPAELEIARLLDEAGLACFYRQALKGAVRPGAHAPSFTIPDRDGQPMLWEHLPHTQSEDERIRWQERQAWYAENGFDAGINLFVTRDEPDGSFNPARLRKVAEYLRSLCA
ncbi:MAG: heat shock protein DnaJ domain protein [Proteobacteria bacterium]|nr:heat shock protein DnaJ domain protein [Pseudomonadota bacterium]